MKTLAAATKSLVLIFPISKAHGMCPHYETPREDPEGACVYDAIDGGEETVAKCWKSWGGLENGFVCPFMD